MSILDGGRRSRWASQPTEASRGRNGSPLRGRFCIGSEESQERVNALYGNLVREFDNREDVSFRREGGSHSVEKVLEVALDVLNAKPEVITKRGMNSMVRPVVAYALCQYAGQTQRQVAEVMALRSGVAVSLRLKKLREQQETNRKLKGILKALKVRLG